VTAPGADQGRTGGPEEQERNGPVIRDRRRLDPETGQLRVPDPAEGAQPAAESSTEGSRTEEQGDLDDLKRQLAERTQDLQRLQAEYVNYKRRVERDRQGLRDAAVASVLTDLLPIVDDIGRAREHGELAGGFKAVAEALEATLSKLGLVRFGEVGDPFDPRIHEALMHAYSDEVTEASASAVLQPGYRHGDRVLRPARVAVAEPTAELPTPEQPGSPDQVSAEQAGEPAPDDQAPPGGQPPSGDDR
jgi:molecular chaperone GrpE